MDGNISGLLTSGTGYQNSQGLTNEYLGPQTANQQFDRQQFQLGQCNSLSDYGSSSLSNYNYTPSYCYSFTHYVDKTDKAIKIIRLLMEDKTIEIKSINKFLELVDKIKAEL